MLWGWQEEGAEEPGILEPGGVGEHYSVLKRAIVNFLKQKKIT